MFLTLFKIGDADVFRLILNPATNPEVNNIFSDSLADLLYLENGLAEKKFRIIKIKIICKTFVFYDKTKKDN